MKTAATNKRIARALMILTVLAVIACMYWAKPILIPLAFAAFFSLLLMPLADLLSRWMPRVFAATGATLAGLAVVGALTFAVAKQLITLAETIPTTMHALLRRVGELTPTGPAFRPIHLGIENMLRQFDTPGAVDAANVPVPAVGAKDAFEVLTTFINPIASLGIICIMVLLILWDRDALIERVVRTLGRGEMNVTTQALTDVRARISRYLTAQLLSNTVFAAATCLGLLVIGIPNILAWCVVSIFLRFIPYVGILVAACVPILLSVGLGGWEVLYVIALYVIVEAIMVSLIEPKWLGQSAGISALALVFSAIFWTFLWGLPGLFIATPLTVCLLMVGKHIPQLGFLNTLLSSESVMQPSARLYQRLLTQDPKEAILFIKQELDSKPLLEVCDAALIPALRMAELDRHHGRLSSERAEKLKETLTLLSENWPTHLPEAVPELLTAYSISNYDRQFVSSPVMCLAATDEADQVASSLFHNILLSLKIPSAELSREMLVGEAVEKILSSPSEIIVITSVPPLALPPVLYLLKRLHRRHCKKRILVGLWGARISGSHDWRSADYGSEVEVATTLEEGLKIVHRWNAGIAAENRAVPHEKSERPLQLAEQPAMG